MLVYIQVMCFFIFFFFFFFFNDTATTEIYTLSLHDALPISILLLPSQVAQYFTNSETDWVKNLATGIVGAFGNPVFYNSLYFLLVVAFTFFYTAFTFVPNDVADNIKRYGGFIPGIRPGRPTAEFLSRVVTRITIAGALFLG